MLTNASKFRTALRQKYTRTRINEEKPSNEPDCQNKDNLLNEPGHPIKKKHKQYDRPARNNKFKRV